MGLIPANQARGLFTQSLVDVYKQIPPTSNFLEMFFPKKTSSSRYIYWSVRRQGEPKAVDVIRGTDGNRNTFSISTDKIVDPPYFREYFDVTQTDLYYRAWDSALIDESKMADWMNWVLEQTQSLHDKIKRSYEYQRAQVLTTGIITYADGTTVDYKRNAASKIAYSSGIDWAATTGSPAVSTVNPFAAMAGGAQYLRTYGKAMGGNFIIIMGDNVKAAFDTNTFVLERQRTFNMKLDDLTPPFREANGSAYHGRISIGDYTGDIFTYPQFYDTSTPANPNTSTPYIDPNALIMIPMNPRFITGYAAVPFLPKSNESGFDLAMPAIQAGEYAIGNYMDSKKIAWEVDIRSAGIALPTAVDMIWTSHPTTS